MFHAISIKPGEKHVSSLRMVWRVTSAALDKSVTLSATDANSKKATAICFHKDGVAHTLCTLRPMVCEQQMLDLAIAPDQPIEFAVSGAHQVHLSGMLSFENDSDSDDGEYESASEEDDDIMHGLRFEDDSDDEDDEGLGDASYGTMALAAMAQGQDFDDGDDSEDDEEWGDDDEEDDDEEDDETDEDDSDEDGPRIQELTAEELEAFQKSQQQANRVKREKKPVAAAAKKPAADKTPVKAASKADKSPAKSLKSPAVKHDDNGEPLAKRKPVPAESPKPQETKKAQQSPAAKDTKPQQQQPQQQIKLPGGMTAKTIKGGNGKAVKPGARVFVRYRGRLAQNGREFDSNMTGKPFQFRLGKGEVIKGWDEGVKGMKAGEVRELKIPPALAYGSRGAPPSIPGNSTLLFTVELLRFK
ncbi:uncharacterized protein LOC135825604 [Sycon ciliatum]|uniref:uncharacterized protein LOC135825604 n=1 Tax=Sycon ciliatum TaxID=27933 RepID=UPI0020AB33A7|eukprot:scpid64954/ scgid34271/ FK506-binding protein 4; Peptidyl-prolyl cis-trans isomerase; Rotamase